MKYQAIAINTQILSVNLMLYLIHDNVFLQSSSGILVVHFVKYLLLSFSKVEF